MLIHVSIPQTVGSKVCSMEQLVVCFELHIHSPLQLEVRKLGCVKVEMSNIRLRLRRLLK